MLSTTFCTHDPKLNCDFIYNQLMCLSLVSPGRAMVGICKGYLLNPPLLGQLYVANPLLFPREITKQ